MCSNDVKYGITNNNTVTKCTNAWYGSPHLKIKKKSEFFLNKKVCFQSILKNVYRRKLCKAIYIVDSE